MNNFVSKKMNKSNNSQKKWNLQGKKTNKKLIICKNKSQNYKLTTNKNKAMSTI